MQWDRVIIEKILKSLNSKKEITILLEDKKLINTVKSSNIIHISKNCYEADFVLGSNRVESTCKKASLVFNYHEFLKNPNAIAVFFWQKGRPTIRFSSKKLKKFNLHVRGELSKFVSKKY